MKYIVMDVRANDIFTDEFNSITEAIEYAVYIWGSMWDIDKAKVNSFYVIESDATNGEEVNYYEGKVLKEYK